MLSRYCFILTPLARNSSSGQALDAPPEPGRRGSFSCPIPEQALRAPYRRLTSSSVSAVVRRACRRAGVAPFGAHRLWHTAATEMLRAGATLADKEHLSVLEYLTWIRDAMQSNNGMPRSPW